MIKLCALLGSFGLPLFKSMNCKISHEAEQPPPVVIDFMRLLYPIDYTSIRSRDQYIFV